MAVQDLLSRLDRVKRSGPDSWTARCPGHDDKGPSLSVRETNDGTVLIHCFAGCPVEHVVSSVGLKLDDLFPPKQTNEKKQRRPFPAESMIESFAQEAGILLIVAHAVRAKRDVSEVDWKRFLLAVERIQRGLDYLKQR